MIEYFADLHVHIGRTRRGAPVKVTASPGLTLESILHEAAERKGIDAIAIVDAASPDVLGEIAEGLDQGELIPQEGGGLRYRGKLTLFLAVEVGIEVGRGEAHFIAYLPDVASAGAFSRGLAPYVTNLRLSSQKARCTAGDLIRLARDCGGFVVPAHAFTPHKGYYGRSADRLADFFSPSELAVMPAIELGLSADTAMAARISELDRFSFVSNSDAHSVAKIAREYNRIRARDLSFAALEAALRGEAGAVTANYGLDPRLGKYHRSYCLACAVQIPLLPERVCPRCGSRDIVAGVADRLEEVADRDVGPAPVSRPPYVHQVPLEYVPGVGPRTLDRLIKAFGSEMKVLHLASEDELGEVVPASVARAIVAAREGRLQLASGGGGRYGRVEGIVGSRSLLPQA